MDKSDHILLPLPFHFTVTDSLYWYL